MNKYHHLLFIFSLLAVPLVDEQDAPQIVLQRVNDDVAIDTLVWQR